MKYPYLESAVVGAVAVILSVASVHAQDQPAPSPGGPGGPPHRPNIEERLSQMKDKLSLSDDQVAKLKTIFEDQKAKIDPIWKDASLSPEQKREKAKPVVEETGGKVDAVLTPEQKAKLQEIRKTMREKRKAKGS